MSRWNGSFAALVCLAGLASPRFVAAQSAVRVGVEFQVNSHTADQQADPAVATDHDGDFVVVWTASYQDGDDTGIFARRFDSAGAAQAAEFAINSYTASKQHRAAVAADSDGDFVVTWESYGQNGYNYGIFARRFNSSGGAQATEFQVSAYTNPLQHNPKVATSSAGDFIVVWFSVGQAYGIFGRRFDSAGAPQATEFQVDSYTAIASRYPAVAASSDGDFVVVWESSGDGSYYGIFARRFDSAGAAQATELQVNSYTTGQQRFPAVAASSEGAFVVAWMSFGQDGSNYGIFARRFDSSGSAQASEFQVNSYTTGYQSYVAVAADSDGDFVIAWQSATQDGGTNGVFARRFNSGGGALAKEFQVNSYTTSFQRYPAVASDADGDFVVAWQSFEQDGSDFGIFAQRFAGPAVLDVDDDGALGPLTDGVLVLRFQFGFTGATLTAGAVGGGCGRCSAAVIQPYLSGLGLVLDIDGNGSIGALTDGLLALRFLFGFTGTTLTSGATGSGCSRCDGAAIATYLQGLA